MSHSTHTRIAVQAAGLAALVLITGCTMKSQDAPALAGPSSLATSLIVTASPDTIPQDGASQSHIAVVARDASNQPIPNLAMRVDVTVGNNFANDFGRLSARNITTGADGRATVVYTAPQGVLGDSTPETMVRIYVVPVGSNFDNANPYSVSIRLVPPATIYVPGSPIASFVYSPSSPKALQEVSFNASASRDPDGAIVQYQWTYGDGDIEYGMTQTHDFPSPGTYNVILTVTDNVGNRASTSRPVTITP